MIICITNWILLIGSLSLVEIESFTIPRNTIPFVHHSHLKQNICAFSNSFNPQQSSFFFSSSSSSSSSSLDARLISYNQFDDENEDEFDDEDDDDEDDDDEDDDVYSQLASSEFSDDSAITSLDWGSALGSLRQRVGDIESGLSKKPSQNLFRMMTQESPNEAIGKFVKEANPEVLSAMTGAVNGLLGGLSNPAMGIDTIVKANGQKVASLCFQLQMTGYIFRNAEYVVALKELMKIKRDASINDFKAAFDGLDTDKSGFIEAREVDALLSDVYDGQPPAFEVQAFLKFFDMNKDGRISWSEFEEGLGVMQSTDRTSQIKSLPGFSVDLDDDMDNDEDDEEVINDSTNEPQISGTIEVELADGKVIEVEATDYIEGLKQQAEVLKQALRRERGQGASPFLDDDSDVEISPDTILNGPTETNLQNDGSGDGNSNSGGITALIASLGGDMKQLTQGISPEVVDAMKLLVDFVLDGGSKNTKKKKEVDLERELELPGAALQQLALWQLILGYRLREAEATGDYKRLLDN